MISDPRVIQDIVARSCRRFVDTSHIFSSAVLRELEITLIEPFFEDLAIGGDEKPQSWLWQDGSSALPLTSERYGFSLDTFTDESGRRFDYFVRHFRAASEPRKPTAFIGIATANSERRIADFIAMVHKDLSLLDGTDALLGICVNSSCDGTLYRVLETLAGLSVPSVVFYIPKEEFDGLVKPARIATAKNVMYHYLIDRTFSLPDYWIGLDDDITLRTNGSSELGRLLWQLNSYKLVSGTFAVVGDSKQENQPSRLLSLHKLPEVIDQSLPRPIAYGAFFATRFTDYLPVPAREGIPDDVFWTMSHAAAHLRDRSPGSNRNHWPVTTLPQIIFLHRGKRSLREWIESKEGILLSAREISAVVGEGYRLASRTQAGMFQQYWRVVQTIVAGRFGSQSLEYAAHLYTYRCLLPALVGYWREQFWYFESPYPEEI